MSKFENCTKLRYRFHKSAKVMTFLCTSEKIMILFQLDKGAIENIDERLKESLSIYLKRKEKLQFLKKALYFAPTLTETKQHILLSICHMLCNRLTGKRNLEAKYLQLIRIAIRTLKKREEFFNKL